MILAFDTTGKRAGICLYKSDEDFTLRESREELHHLTELVPMLDKLLEDEGVGLSEIETYAVSAGPGSFTGIRIGISTVRALAQAGISDYLNSVISVPTLETFVFNEPQSSDSNTIVCPLFDARRSQVYAGAYTLSLSGEHPEINTLVKGDAYTPEDFFELLSKAVSKSPDSPPTVKFYGDGAEQFSCGYKGSSSIADIQYRYQSALSTARWASNFGVPIPYTELEPIYMRQAEAQRKLEAGIIKPRA